MRNDPNDENVDNEKTAVTLPGVVEKIVKPITPGEPEKSADSDTRGRQSIGRFGSKTRLRMLLEKPGAEVDVTIEAPVEAVEKKTQ